MAKEKEKTVKVKLPRVKGEDAVPVWVNEDSWLIKRGEEVDVPECVAEVLEESEKRKDIAYEYDMSVQR